jgi:hypothetical protein
MAYINVLIKLKLPKKIQVNWYWLLTSTFPESKSGTIFQEQGTNQKQA